MCIQRNAERIAEMRSRIHELSERRNDPESRRAWQQVCAEFHATYDSLAFPGGYRTALDRLGCGDSETIDAALAFLELRPYFFQSGYMRETLMRRLKHVPMSDKQSKRFEAVREAERNWRANRRKPAQSANK
jgi:hypothetical protein